MISILKEIPLYRRILYWLIIGVVFSLCFAATKTTRNGGIHQFFDDGYVWDLKGIWTNVIPENGEFSLDLDHPQEEKKYFVIDAEGFDDGALIIVINEYDKNESIIGRKYNTLAAGKNIIVLPRNDGTKHLTVSLVSSTPSQSYTINEVRVSEYKELSDYSRFDGHFFIGIIIYLIVSVFLYIVWIKTLKQKTNYHIDISGIAISEILPKEELIIPYSEKIRTICFLLLIIGWRVATMFSIRKYYGFAVIMHVIMLWTIIACIPIGYRKPIKVNAMMLLLAMFALLSFISDLIVTKMWGFVQIWFILSFVPFAIALYESKHPEEVLWDFFKAVDIVFLLNILYIIVGKSVYSSEGSIIGTWSNRNPFGLNMVFFTIVLIVQVASAFREKEWIKCSFRFIEVMVAMYLVYRSDSRTNIICLILIVAFYLFCNIWHWSKGSRLLVILMGCLLIAVSIVGAWGIAKGVMTGRSINEMSLDSISSGRITNWIMNIKSINLFGHEDRLMNQYGIKCLPHNVFIKLAYKYGVIVGTLGLIMGIESIFLIKNVKNIDNIEYMFVGMVTIIYAFSGLIECVNEYPNERLIATAFYIAIAYVLAKIGETETQA